MYLEKGKVEFKSCKFENNTALSGGGGVAYIDSSDKVSFENSVLFDNRCPVKGAGIYVKSIKELNLVDCELKGHKAEMGSAMHVSLAEKLVMDRCVFEGNLASLHGSGVRFEECGSVLIENSHFFNNKI